MNSEDWKAAMSSEIFRNYASIELHKQAASVMTMDEEIDFESEVLNDFDSLQAKINKSPILKAAFKKMQDTFVSDPEYTSKVSPSFVESIMMLHLEDKNAY